MKDSMIQCILSYYMGCKDAFMCPPEPLSEFRAAVVARNMVVSKYDNQVLYSLAFSQAMVIINREIRGIETKTQNNEKEV